MMYGLMILVERDTKSDGHGLRVTLPYELPRNILEVRWTSVVLIHTDLGKFNKIFKNPKNLASRGRAPRARVRGATSGHF